MLQHFTFPGENFGTLVGEDQGWHIGLPIYRHYLEYRLSVSVKVRTDKISVIGYRLWPNIGSEYRLNFGDFPPIYR